MIIGAGLDKVAGTILKRADRTEGRDPRDLGHARCEVF